MRIVYAGEPVIDQFPVWNEEQTAKISGISSFTKISWKNGVSQIMSVTITEISATPGEYMMTFNPPDVGFWKVEVGVPSTGDSIVEVYDVRKRPYRARFMAVKDTIEQILIAIAVENDDGTRATDFTTATASILSPDDGTVISNLGSATPTAQGVFNYIADNADIPAAAGYLISFVGTKGSLTWTYNLWFTKVA